MSDATVPHTPLPSPKTALGIAIRIELERLATMSELGLPHPRHYLLPAAAAAALTTIGIAAAISISLN